MSIVPSPVKPLRTARSASSRAGVAQHASNGRALQKGQQTKLAIVEAALGLSTQIGLEGLSIGVLAEVTHKSKSGVFAHFGSREELQSAREEMQTSQEELKSRNEELQSTNEELQSTNEELTTSKEEMQSMNEELHTVNQELTSKVDELSLASDDMNNLLNSTDIATLFLDNELKVRRFTTQAAGIIKLIPGDAGRPVTDLANVFDSPALAVDAREVLRTLVASEARVPTQDGRWLRVRTMPYRTQDHRIDGVVITFTDISVSKALETTLREALAVLQGRFKDQGAALDAAHTLEGVLQAAQSVLEQRIGAQTVELRRARAEVLAERDLSAGRRPAP